MCTDDARATLPHNLLFEPMITNNAECPCPACSNVEWKLASLVHAEGAYAINLQTAGSGVSVGGAGLNVGVTSSTSQGTNISVLAQRAAPPENQLGQTAMGVGMIGAIIGAAAGYFSSGFLLMLLGIFGGMFGGGIIGMIFFWKSSNEQYKQAMEHYQKVRMCTRCGHFYTPAGAT